MAVVQPTVSVHQAVLKMLAVRAGLAVALDEAGGLAGIFTHGDFVRHLLKHPDLLDRPVGDFLTRRPVTIRADKLAVEVLHLIENHRVDDVVVIDEQDRPVGVVDSQDLARFKVV